MEVEVESRGGGMDLEGGGECLEDPLEEDGPLGGEFLEGREPRKEK